MNAWARIVGGAIAVLIGLVWVLQGLNVLPGSVMTGDLKWFWIGLVLGAGGLWLAVNGLGRLKKPR